MGRRRRDDPSLHGVLLVDKPLGPTSHDVVGWVRWVLGVGRVGHCGTLDPGATGLLVVAVGGATKLVPYLSGQDKGYRATFGLGRRTDTADAQGRTLEEQPCSEGLEARVPQALQWLRGEHELPPPAFSAVHVDGKRAHELAREGVLDEALPTRPMVVRELQPGRVSRRGDAVEIEATLLVSKGTYIRSLAEALGAQLGVPAHLVALHRERSGSLSLSEPRAVRGLSARALEPGPRGQPRWRIEAPPEAGEGREAVAQWLRSRWLEPAQAVPLPLCRVPAGDGGPCAMRRLLNGQAVSLEEACSEPVPPDAERVAVVPADPSEAGLLVARVSAGEGDHRRLEPERVIVPPRHP